MNLNAATDPVISSQDSAASPTTSYRPFPRGRRNRRVRPPSRTSTLCTPVLMQEGWWPVSYCPEDYIRARIQQRNGRKTLILYKGSRMITIKKKKWRHVRRNLPEWYYNWTSRIWRSKSATGWPARDTCWFLAEARGVKTASWRLMGG